MIQTILWDIDGTLLDFRASEREAIASCFSVFGLGTCTDEMTARYSAINLRYWKMLERGEVTKPDLLVNRFRDFFTLEGIDFSGYAAFNDEYQIRLGDTIVFRDNSFALVSSLRGRVRQYAVTNGTSRAQERKLARSGLDRIFDGVFISDAVGYEKPAAGFFDHVLSAIGPVRRRETMIVGDSLTSDMRGGADAGLVCVWYDPESSGDTMGVPVDFIIRDLNEVPGLLGR